MRFTFDLDNTEDRPQYRIKDQDRKDPYPL